ncbi:hypothetical protein PQZ66_gp87 [Klebsiella phage vB_KleM_KB2]|nr:hypothetical protein PQZ66_gp87 [Klebsiella phage vB_KleM_KB2]
MTAASRWVIVTPTEQQESTK